MEIEYDYQKSDTLSALLHLAADFLDTFSITSGSLWL